MVKLCKESINARKGSPERMVRKCESIYRKVLKKKLEQGMSDGIARKPLSGVRNVGKIEYCAMKIIDGLIRIASGVERSIKRITS